MTSLDEKKVIKVKNNKSKRWLVILAALLCFVILGAIVIGVLSDKADPGEVSDTFTVSNTTSKSATYKDEFTLDNSTLNDNSDSPLDRESNLLTSNTKQNESLTQTKNVTNNKSPQTQVTSGNTTVQNQKTTTTTSKVNENSTTKTTKAVVSNVTYVYREAKNGDDFSVSYPIENCIVITDVTTKSSDGTYIIPEKLDGKKVLAIMGGAFCNNNISSSVKKVVVPSSVKTIWNHAFSSCYNLTDIYFRGSSIYTESNAFANESKRNSTLTIHCSASCSDRNFRYYKNSAGDYGAKYKEWNGGAYN